MLSSTGRKLMNMFDLMLDHFGPQHWWPGETAIEIMIGAVLTQNTNWTNVEKAIDNLKREGFLSVESIHTLSTPLLARCIRSAGYYNIKAARLKNLIGFIRERYHGDIASLLEEDTDDLRKGLLSVSGVGPETADSILLYAANRPVFVIDAYTYRIMNRHGLAGEQVAYEDLQELFMDNLPGDEALFNEFHALIVRTGKQYCRRSPLCNACPLEEWHQK